MIKYSVYLRPFIISDAEKINEWRNNEKIQSLTCGRFRMVSMEIEKSWVQDKITHNSNEEYFAVCLTDGNNEMIGYVCIKDIDLYNRKCHFAGIVIDPKFQEGTYMIEANLLLMDYTFMHLGMNRMTGKCLEEHITSRVMMEMLGYELEGIEKESILKYHKYHNVCLYALRYSKYQEFRDNNLYSLASIAKRAKNINQNINNYGY